jgi:hypothetical protein
MLTVVVELVTALKAACTADAEQLAALMVCAFESGRAHIRSMAAANDFRFMVTVKMPFL